MLNALVFNRLVEVSQLVLSKLDAENNGRFVQLVIPNPLTVGGHKFDLAYHVLVTSFDPPRIYLLDGKCFSRDKRDFHKMRDRTSASSSLVAS